MQSVDLDQCRTNNEYTTIIRTLYECHESENDPTYRKLRNLLPEGHKHNPRKIKLILEHMCAVGLVDALHIETNGVPSHSHSVGDIAWKWCVTPKALQYLKLAKQGNHKELLRMRDTTDGDLPQICLCEMRFIEAQDELYEQRT